MKLKIRFRILLTISLVYTLGISSTIITVSPPPNEGPLRNPYRGWNTKWYDKAQPKYSSLACLSLSWSSIQTAEDVYDWDKMDEYMNDEGSKGSFISINVYSDKLKDKNEAPAYIYDEVDILSYNHNGSVYKITDCNDSYYLQEVLKYIKAFYEHY